MDCLAIFGTIAVASDRNPVTELDEIQSQDIELQFSYNARIFWVIFLGRNYDYK